MHQIVEIKKISEIKSEQTHNLIRNPKGKKNRERELHYNSEKITMVIA